MAVRICRFPRLVGNVIQIAGGIGVIQVDRRGEHPFADRLHAEDRLDTAGRPEEVAGHRFGRTDGEPAGMFAEDRFDGLRLVGVVQRGGGPVGVDVVDSVGVHPRILQGDLHAPGGAFMPRRRGGHVKGVACDCRSRRARRRSGRLCPGREAGLRESPGRSPRR